MLFGSMSFGLRIRGAVAAASACIALASVALVCSSAHAQSVAEFYKGKNVDLLIGYSGGGGYDVYARLLARHISKHIPGNPNVVPRNMPGAGSLVLANWLANVAPKEGTAFGIIGSGTGFDPLLGIEAAKFDPTRFLWVGSMNNESSVCVSWHTSGFTRFEDTLAKEMIVGGTGPSADVDQFPRITNAELGTKFKIVSGYPGGNDINLAMERGEVHGRCGWSWSSVVATRMDWFRQKRVHVLFQMALDKHSDLPDVPLVIDLAKNDEQRQILRLIFARQALGRPFLAPPGLPADRAAALRQAFMATMKDPVFLAEADKATLEIRPLAGEAVQTIIADAAKTDLQILKKAAAVVQIEPPAQSQPKQ
jgi:tripartite-type tricarboxylate transporter receptor subunit TctC